MTKITLDVRGAKCPVPLVRAKQAIDTLSPGAVLEVLASDPGSIADFTGWAKVSRSALLREQRTEIDAEGRKVYVHILERKA